MSASKASGQHTTNRMHQSRNFTIDLSSALSNCRYVSANEEFRENVCMKSYRKELWFQVKGRRAFVNITPQINECLHESGVREGLVLVNAMHITASVFINDDESGLHHDYDVWLEKLAPHEPVSGYHH